ncbi:hypothetical protein CDAR_414711 [Caerostris darwini]|uniref:Uncharacterized protein n=1 Tax=Caerostris darwini TaxID=1538125 RepID=A0AAV4RC35_9ARAC|nr:hypothetical protein CDAR_414711 [Caerostris darwini]
MCRQFQREHFVERFDDLGEALEGMVSQPYPISRQRLPACKGSACTPHPFQAFLLGHKTSRWFEGINFISGMKYVLLHEHSNLLVLSPTKFQFSPFHIRNVPTARMLNGLQLAAGDRRESDKQLTTEVL